jgi:hypothetical protein
MFFKQLELPLTPSCEEIVYIICGLFEILFLYELDWSDQLMNLQGLTERALDQRCQLMVVCRGAEAIVRCSPCMHTIACRGCFLASVTLLKSCTTCGFMVEHFKIV